MSLHFGEKDGLAMLAGVQTLKLPLGLEAPVMTPYGVKFLLFLQGC